MYRLVELAGLDENLYRGQRENNLRNGLGIQIFPNGYFYYGMWKNNMANGKGKLLYTDGTYYKGLYENNSIIKGGLYFWNGRKFEGDFYGGPNEFFKCGRFYFKDGDVFEGKWNNFGSCTDGRFISKNGDVIKFEKQKKLIKYDDQAKSLGKIIVNDIIYEGGIKNSLRHGFGCIYSTFQHYNQSFFIKDCYNGFAIGNRISFGETCEGNIYNDKIVHIWKRMTVRGYEIIGNVKENRYHIKFPFLNDDHFIGEILIDWTWNQNHHLVNFKSGKYFIRSDDSEFCEIDVKDITSIDELPDVSKRGTDFELVFNRLKSYYKIKGLFQINEILEKALEKAAPSDQNKINLIDMQQEIFFRGCRINENKEGYCQIEYDSGEKYAGFFKNDKKEGPGQLIKANSDIYLGDFSSNVLEGSAVVYNDSKGVFLIEFASGTIQSNVMMKFNNSELIYIGEIDNFKFKGNGKLIFRDEFEITASFANDEIEEMSTCQIKLKEMEPIEAVYFKVNKRTNMAMFETSDKKILLIDVLKGKWSWVNI